MQDSLAPDKEANNQVKIKKQYILLSSSEAF